MRIYMWLVFVLIICGITLGCRQPDSGGHTRARSKIIMYNIHTAILIAEREMNEAIPITLHGLVDWLFKDIPPSVDTSVECEIRAMKDAWGNPLIVLSDESGKFIGLGSAGPDGFWQNGQGDDIIVTLDEVRIRRGWVTSSLTSEPTTAPANR